jgi:hypothetical protein
MKLCAKCETTKPTTEFYKDSRRKCGLQSYCKACHGSVNAAWHASNREQQNAYSAEWKASNPERHAAHAVKYRAKNPEKASDCVSKWIAANPEARRIYKHNRRARETGGKLSTGLSDRLFKLQRGKCACGCKHPLGDDYHLDHRMPLALGGTNTDDNMQLLTATCNLQKSAKHPIDFMQQRGFLL